MFIVRERTLPAVLVVLLLALAFGLWGSRGPPAPDAGASSVADSPPPAPTEFRSGIAGLAASGAPVVASSP